MKNTKKRQGLYSGFNNKSNSRNSIKRAIVVFTVFFALAGKILKILSSNFVLFYQFHTALQSLNLKPWFEK